MLPSPQGKMPPTSPDTPEQRHRAENLLQLETCSSELAPDPGCFWVYRLISPLSTSEWCPLPFLSQFSDLLVHCIISKGQLCRLSPLPLFCKSPGTEFVDRNSACILGPWRQWKLPDLKPKYEEEIWKWKWGWDEGRNYISLSSPIWPQCIRNLNTKLCSWLPISLTNTWANQLREKRLERGSSSCQVW